MSRADHPRSIAVPIFALVVTAVFVVTATFFAVTFSGPPPRAAPMQTSSIAAFLQAPRAQSRDSRRMTLTEGAAPVARADERPSIGQDVIIAAALDAAPRDVRGFYSEPGGDRRNEIRGGFTIGWKSAGIWRVVRTDPEPLFTRWHLVTLGAMLAAMLLLAGPAWWIARAISKPLRQLADTATTARAGAPLGTLPAGGASEVRDLTRAVSAMHQRLTRHAEGRTTMLAAIAHDLGTPLSRLSFRVEHLPEEARERAAADIAEMRAMIASLLRFARDEASERSDARIDLGSMLDALVEDMHMAGTPVSLEPGERAIVRGDPQALRRLFTNLIDNAVRYGESAVLSWHVADGIADILIDDRGPGVDPVQAERLFEPFVRGDPSRNRATGGTGLGLAIVRGIAESHGGTVTLERHDGHGRARVRLPVEANR
ncbi:HAMP domain-containing sensor histidine kinase [Sphingomonas alpina]|uniref:histidine kinase n=1 Tax=Sphingomonas alpina TaxID=653931 RepID=A0A7H0LDF3_9SPHN|nr:HAMP domain-containing sensor histidine kinase [Sphingomonas alpina]QNQ07706.1 HAMP domain-containing histidine kinase [Sphingomonas alpina]